MIDFHKGPKIISSNEIYLFFIETDNDFYPQLSYRLNIKEYAKKLYMNANLIVSRDSSNNKIVGLTAFYANNYQNMNAFLSNINVKKSYSGKGIAKQMMDIMHKDLIKKGFKSITLEVYKNNSRAINIYKKQGFVIYNQKNQYYTMIKTFEKNA
jgi:ribosomal protein S18 acetylase RimI-like enzyme